MQPAITGSIFNIQRYSTHDGPGVRTTVFFKGCPLSCLWCHNPESQDPEPEFIFHQSYCIACGACATACPQQAISMRADKPEMPDDACTRCQTCLDHCHTGAREFAGSAYTPEELLAEICKDRVFYEESGGGVTFSGGEPLAQPEFLSALLPLCHDAGIHICLDTTLHASAEVVERLGKLADLWLIDLKLMDGELHRRATGVDTARILENILRLDAMNASLLIRMPIVPGWTDDQDDIKERARWLSRLNNLCAVELLPYHTLATGKRGAKPDLAITPPSSEKMQKLRSVIKEYNLPLRGMESS